MSKNHSFNKRITILQFQMLPDKHIRTKKTFYLGVITFCILYIFQESYRINLSLLKTVSSVQGLIAVLVLLFGLYKLLLGKGKIILTATRFKVAGYSWADWNELVYMHPYTESDSENGPRYFLKFMLTDGTELVLRHENLEMDVSDVIVLVNQYKAAYMEAIPRQGEEN